MGGCGKVQFLVSDRRRSAVLSLAEAVPFLQQRRGMQLLTGLFNLGCMLCVCGGCVMKGSMQRFNAPLFLLYRCGQASIASPRQGHVVLFEASAWRACKVSEALAHLIHALSQCLDIKIGTTRMMKTRAVTATHLKQFTACSKLCIFIQSWNGSYFHTHGPLCFLY